MSDRDFELVLLGATGFTGQLVARWLAETETELRWALAGRTQSKLEAIRDTLAADFPHLSELPCLRVDVTEADTVAEMARRTQVVLTTAGPFQHHGPPVVAACVAEGTDYVDITGEPDFVAEMIRTHHQAASDKGVRIVNCAGMDSIPFDLGAWFTAQQLPQKAPMTIRGYFRLGGKISGGTWNTIVTTLGNGGQPDTSGLVYRGPDRRARGLRTRLHRGPSGLWGLAVPTVDPLIVLRSAQTLGYGPDFRYAHHVSIKNLSSIAALGVGFAASAVLAQFGPTRRWLGNRVPPGTGPSKAQQEAGWLSANFYGVEGGREVHCRLTTDIDPGYSFTARMVACAALCLARDRDQLTEHVGVVTTAAAMAEPLKIRLEAAGMGFHVNPTR
jgi:saccharopine dehydrogenase (NAD+, L-glutamate forming)